MDFLIVATTLGIVAAVWGVVLVVLIAWRAVGRLRLQRRTEARLHEEGKKRLLRARDKVKAELRTNGSGSSERSAQPSATDGNTRGR